MDYDIRELHQTEWPPLLHEIPDKPKRLFAVGTLPPPNHKLLVVVGSRKHTPYGKMVCEHLIKGLRGFPITIVSGLALGLDACAHKSALKANLQTLAVPGSGLSPRALYPATHLSLARDIVEHGGGLLSEFEPNFRATTWSFPQRNRIMAGMSHAVLVIEAEEKSGTLITSRLATEYNREVLTVPGSIFSSHTQGPHMLIRLGATPVTQPEDILETLGFDIKIQEEHEKEINMTNLSESEVRIVTLLKTHPREKDEVLRETKLSISELQRTLMMLELKGLVKEVGGNCILINTLKLPTD